MEQAFQEGQLILINKPYLWTSFDVVNFVRNLLRRDLGLPKIKIGHAGTLDPLATGLLILVTGKFTKKIESLQDLEKEYTGTMVFGTSTPSFDLETEPDAHYPYDHLTGEMLQQACQAFTGDIQQVPPVFSAIKIGGKRAYKFARKQQDVRLAPRPVHIEKLELTRIAFPEVDFRVVCSKGTYIRSLVRDLGLAVGSGAYLSALCRTRIGNYSLSDAQEPEAYRMSLSGQGAANS